jgi:NTE family protein
MHQRIKLLILLFFIIMLSSCSSPNLIIPHPHTLPPPRKIENVNVALVLGGGGAKGIAHLGVIEVLEEHNIPIDLIVGTSAGSIVGALYADYKDARLLHETLFGINKWDLLDLSILDSLSFFASLKGPVQGYYLEEFMIKHTSVNNIEDLKIPFVAVATDLYDEKPFLFESGPISLGVHASAAIPPVFSPVNMYGKLLVDGGVVEPVPVRVARKYNPKLIIAVDISTPGREYPIETMMDLTYRSLYVSYYTLSRMQSTLGDINIHPDCTGYGVFDDKGQTHLYKLGRKEALKAIPHILNALKSRNIKLDSQSKH